RRGSIRTNWWRHVHCCALIRPRGLTGGKTCWPINASPRSNCSATWKLAHRRRREAAPRRMTHQPHGRAARRRSICRRMPSLAAPAARSGPMSALEQTAAQYRSLRWLATAGQLGELLADAEASDLSYLHFAQRLAEYEAAVRTRSRITRHLKQAQFPAEKPLESFDYRHQTTITKRQVNALLDFSFIDQ